MVSQELRAILPLSASSVEPGLCRRLHNCSVGWRLGVYACSLRQGRKKPAKIIVD